VTRTVILPPRSPVIPLDEALGCSRIPIRATVLARPQ
jgi:hypothetical protein